ncbi:general transcription factor IIH subunit 5 [Arapaima gigas]
MLAAYCVQTWCSAKLCCPADQYFTLFSLPLPLPNMVNVLKGILVECDPAMKQFLLYLDETSALGKKFIIQDLDDTHVFILAEVVQILQEKVGELMDQNSFPITQK